MKFKKPVPESRTIVPGTWSDILDAWLASFDAEGSETEVRVNLKNLGEITSLLALSFSRMQEQNDEMIAELKLLNARLEHGFETALEPSDVED